MKTFGLWALALVIMFAAAHYQRRTGPTYPVHGVVQTPAGPKSYELLRSHETDAGAPVVLPAGGNAATLYWRRYPLNEPFQAIPMTVAGDSVKGVLPPQPAAGKVEYYVEFAGTPVQRVPADESVVLRYKGAVPLGVLLPHILFMFISMLIAARAGLGALVGRDEPRLAWTALIGFTIGGLVLGPIVQKYAFDAYWTGVPFGWDLTDNKTLIMWLAWVLACLVPLKWPRARRGLLVLATVVTIVVYVIPHSMRGSQLDYSATAAQPR